MSKNPPPIKKQQEMGKDLLEMRNYPDISNDLRLGEDYLIEEIKKRKIISSIRTLLASTLVPAGVAGYFIFKADALDLGPTQLVQSMTIEEIILLISIPLATWKEQWDEIFK